MSYNVAIVGAIENTGRQILDIISERKLPINKLYCLASIQSTGKKVSFGDATVAIEDYATFDFKKVDIAIFLAGVDVSKRYALSAARSTIVIDCSSYFSLESDVELIIPEINSHKLNEYKKSNIIASPSSPVIQLLIALKPLHDVAKIKRIVITTLQSVSDIGNAAMDELYNQTKARFMGNSSSATIFPKPISFNLLPHVGEFDKEGNTSTEVLIIQEVKKILGSHIAVTATCIRVPVFIGHSESVNVEFEFPLSAVEARKLIKSSKSVTLKDNPSSPLNYITPAECVGDDNVYVSRIRVDNSINNCLNLWIVSDNLRKGVALNTVQIAQELIKNYI